MASDNWVEAAEEQEKAVAEKVGNIAITGKTGPGDGQPTGTGAAEATTSGDEKDLTREKESLWQKLLRTELVQSSNELEISRRDPSQPHMSAATSFEDLPLRPELKKAVYSMGFRTPLRFQAAALPLLLHDPPQNLILQSGSGTGRTLAFVLTMLNRVNPAINHPQVLCLVPTFKLAIQTKEVVEQIGKFCPEIKARFAIRYELVEKGSKLTEHIIIGTPKKITDWVFRFRCFDLGKIQVFVLGNADVMIATQGLHDMCIKIHKALPWNSQKLLFSTTYDRDVMKFAEKLIPKATIMKLNREEQEEKCQFNSLSPMQNNYGDGGNGDRRSGSSMLQGTKSQKKGSEWTTLPDNKASRFQSSDRKQEPGRSSSNQSGPPGSKKLFLPNLPPRMLANRSSNLTQNEGSRQPIKSIPNSSEDSNSREQLEKKLSEWLTCPAFKVREFQTCGNKPESGGNQVFGPPSWDSISWSSSQRNQSGPAILFQSRQPFLPNLPPRMLTNRFLDLAQDEGSRQPIKSISNSFESSDFREQPQQPPPLYNPHLFLHLPPLSIIKAFPPPSKNFFPENSGPVNPKNIPQSYTADTSESVKNIFQEYLSCKKFDETLYWIKRRFPGSQINDFVDEMSRQAVEILSKEEEQKCAGSLVRLLIEKTEIPKDSVIQLIARGIMQDLPDILIDAPMATSYLAQFLVELFSEDQNLDWLVQVGETLIVDSEEEDSLWNLLAVNSLNLLKLRKNVGFVQDLLRQTKRKKVIPTDKVPWLQGKSIDTLAEEMVKVLSQKLDSSDEIGQIFQEYSWDVKDDRTAFALNEAICTLTWNSEARSWDDAKLKKLLPLLQPIKTMFPLVWEQVRQFAERGLIDNCNARCS